jgi:hypothetical protein
VHAVLVQLDKVVTNKAPQQPHKITDLGFRARPILGTERKDGQDFDADVSGGSHRSAQRFDSTPMTFRAWQSTRRGPAAIAVHDDGNVPGHGKFTNLGTRQSFCTWSEERLPSSSLIL